MFGSALEQSPPSGSLTKAAAASSLQAPLIVIYLAKSPPLGPAAGEAARKLAGDGVLSAGDLCLSSPPTPSLKPLRNGRPPGYTGCFIDSRLYFLFWQFRCLPLGFALRATPYFTVCSLRYNTHDIDTLCVFCSCTVLRKDVREINCDCPPKADAGLKPGETRGSGGGVGGWGVVCKEGKCCSIFTQLPEWLQTSVG